MSKKKKDKKRKGKMPGTVYVRMHGSQSDDYLQTAPKIEPLMDDADSDDIVVVGVYKLKKYVTVRRKIEVNAA